MDTFSSVNLKVRFQTRKSGKMTGKSALWEKNHNTKMAKKCNTKNIIFSIGIRYYGHPRLCVENFKVPKTWWSASVRQKMFNRFTLFRKRGFVHKRTRAKNRWIRRLLKKMSSRFLVAGKKLNTFLFLRYYTDRVKFRLYVWKDPWRSCWVLQ